MEDTIAAVGTPFGEGGIGIVRLSGPLSKEILGKVFAPAGEDAPRGEALKVKPRYLTYGHIIDPESGKTLDEVLCSYMEAPHTYTGEDVVEINCHGGVVPLRKVLELVYSMGARPAERGEFTKRAFLNGRIDLSQAEAVMDVVKAKAEKTFDIAMDQLKGRLSEEIEDIRKGLMDLLVELTVNIDYPDEDIEEITYGRLRSGLEKAKEEIEELIATADTGRIMSEGLKIAIVGKPNVGKSSLMNALLRESRVIVTDIPGTTRDTIEEDLSIGGIPVVLTDTAGIRETSDRIESIGIEKSKDSFSRADIAIFMIDGSSGLDEEDRLIAGNIEPEKTIVLINKRDLPKGCSREDVLGMIKEETGAEEKDMLAVLETSLADGKGTDELESAVKDLVMKGAVSQEESAVVTNARHEHLLRSAKRSVEDALQLTASEEPVEIIEIDVNQAYESLGEITGETSTGDILEEVFSRFCLGK